LRINENKLHPILSTLLSVVLQMDAAHTESLVDMQCKVDIEL